MTTPASYFISDAHLGDLPAGDGSREARLIAFLERIGPRADHLFIVGDLFDFWIEYRQLIRADYFRTLCALAALRRGGTRVHYIAGNHDFALGPFLTDELGLHVYPYRFEGELQGRRLHVCHGDGLLRFDVGYRVMRRVLRSRFNQRLYRMLHPTLGIGLAALVSALSRRFSRGRLSESVLGEYRRQAGRVLARGFDAVVYGHTHYPELYHGAPGTYCNTGDWMRRYTYGKLEAGELTLWRQSPSGEDEQIQARPWK
jgi:UDP-2,3-diacylglucosamine hydrolase